jgi:adenylate kinase
MMCGITGAPGTGKSSVADELGRRGHRVVHISATVGPYVTGTDVERNAEIIDIDRWVTEFVPVDGIVEGHFAHYLPCDRIVVLRCRPDVLKQRLAVRNYRPEKVQENAEAEALDFFLIETVEEYEPDQILELDTTEHTPSYCADRIEGFITGDEPAGFGTLDWSGYLEAGL